MSGLFRTAALIGLVAGALHAQTPVITEITSSASEVLPGLPNSGVAAGSIFVLYGKSIGPSSLVQQSSTTTLPTILSGTQVSFTGGGVTAPAPLFYTFSGQIAGILPSTIPAGSATVTVSYNNTPSQPFPFTVVSSNFSMYSLNGSGTGPGVAVDATNGNTVVTVTNSAAPGDFIVIYGTGLGPLPSGQSDAGIPPVQVNLTTPLQVYVGGVQVNVFYHGRSGDAGLDQINFQVPTGISGCYVPVAIQSSATVVSAITTMAIASRAGTTCSDSNGIPLASLGVVPGASISFGGISLTQTNTVLPAIAGFGGTQTSTSASASFYQFSAAQLSSSASLFSQPSIGGCTVTLINLANSASSVPVFNATGLNAGSPIAISGPSSFSLTPVSGAAGNYASPPSTNAIQPGTYTATGPGGAQVGAFTTSFSVATPLNWTNSNVANVTRSSGQLITWTGGAPGSYVEIQGTSGTGAQGVEAFFICIAPVAAGQFTIPSYVLLSLPQSTSLVQGVPGGTLIVGNYTETPVTPVPTGLNYLYTSSGSSTSILVNYQ